MNLNDTLQLWLQGEINACVAGHASRIERLENAVQHQDVYLSNLCMRLDTLEEVVNRQAQLIEDQRDAFEVLHKGLKPACMENFLANLEECSRVGSLQRLLGSEFNILHEAHNKLASKVQTMLVPETLCADDLLEKVCSSENWGEAVAECYREVAFEDAVNDVVSGKELKEMVKDIVNDLRFDVSVR